MNETDLAAKGYRRQADGSWAKPNRGAVAQLQGSQREPDSPQALVRGRKVLQSRKGRLVVSIIGIRRKILDSDNFCAGAKSVRDAIALSLGADDGDPRITWQYSQVPTAGPEGTIVAIHQVP